MYGLQSGYYAMRQALFEDPLQRSRRLTWGDMASAYALLWAYYDNSMFERDAATFNSWSFYKAQYGLYRNIRLIYNPVRRLVDFYVGQVYPGILSSDGANLPEGIPSAIPFAKDTPVELTSAIGQFWQWTNWQARKSVMIRYGGALGSVLIEVIDDVERGKVTSEIWKPSLVRDLELDASGNVKAYALEYLVQEDSETYTFRKEVDGDAFRYFKDDQPAGTNPNPYGFVPAVWVKHSDIGGDRGSSAFTQFGKVDELNSLAAHVHDQIHKVIGAPMVLWASSTPRNLFAEAKRGSTDEQLQPNAEQEEMLILKGSADGHVDSLAGNLPLGETSTYLDKLLGEIEQDHPELVFYRELRSMSQVTGPAASRLVGDVASRVSEAAANYDRATIALFQMALAIGGFRANSGGWGSLTSQQQKFLPFSLDSYTRGELDFTILPRPLLVPTKYEMALEKQTFWTGVGQAVQAGAPLEAVLRDEGWSDERLAQLGAAQVEKIKRDQMLANEDVIPAQGQ